MKPFSALYYIKENKGRSILLICMFILSYIAWIGGVYVTNMASVFDYSIEETMNKSVMVYPGSSDNYQDQMDEFFADVIEEDGVQIFRQGVVSSIQFNAMLNGLTIGYGGYSFLSVDDFRTYCRIKGLECDFDSLKPGSVIMSELAAANRGMKIGDTLEEKEDENVYGIYTLDAVLDVKGIEVYYIDTGKNGSNYSYILLADGMDEAEFAAYTNQLKENYNVAIYDKSSITEEIYSQLKSINNIYAFIVVMVAVVMAITINAAFVGMYQHREPEFAVYMAIGKSRRQIVAKLAGELILMDIIGLVSGGIIVFCGIYLLNSLYFIPKGLMMEYYHPLAFTGMMLCNLMILLPLMISRSRQMIKSDICEY